MDYTGKLLIAPPSLKHKHFVETVTLVVKHNSEGTLGFVLNRTSSETLKNMWQNIWNANIDPKVYDDTKYVQFGGPVYSPIMSIHDNEYYSDGEIIPGLYYALEPENIIGAIADDAKYLVFQGYSGWNAGQLDLEVEKGTWFVTDIDVDDVFYGQQKDRTFYKYILRKFGEKVYQNVGIRQSLVCNASLN